MSGTEGRSSVLLAAAPSLPGTVNKKIIPQILTERLLMPGNVLGTGDK